MSSEGGAVPRKRDRLRGVFRSSGNIPRVNAAHNTFLPPTQAARDTGAPPLHALPLSGHSLTLSPIGSTASSQQLTTSLSEGQTQAANTSAASSPQTTPSTSTSIAPAPPPAQAKCKFLDDALLKLSEEQRAIILKYRARDSNEISSVVDDVYKAALEKRLVCEDKRWRLNFCGRNLVLRDEADKLMSWLDRFKSVGDVVANSDPVHAGLPWAGVRIMLQAAVAESAQMAALLSGMSLSLYMASRLKLYLGYHRHLPSSPALGHFEESLIETYVLLLEFFASAIQIYQKNAVGRTLNALWQVTSLVTFEANCDKWASRAEDAASICSRQLDTQIWDGIKQWKDDLDKQLKELRRMQGVEDSLLSLHHKIDLANLATAGAATYDSFDDRHLGTCLEGTRTQILRSIIEWADDPHGQFIFWLCGKAGTGKSTISRTVSRVFDRERHCLGATFFFKRGECYRGGAKRFFPTIAAQLAKNVSGMDVLVAEVLDKDAGICEKTLQDQYERLISEPLNKVGNTSTAGGSFVVIVDALDECEHSTDIRTILRFLAKLEIETSFRLRIFVTSRPELPITLGFGEMPSSSHSDVHLEELQTATIEHDIRLYFDDQFNKIKADRLLKRPRNPLPADWPARADIDMLVDLAVPLFIFAATVRRFISEANPKKRLEAVLRQQGGRSYAEIERTYLPILKQLVGEEENDADDGPISRFQKIVGSIVLLADSLPVSALSRLLEIDSEEIDDCLENLHSVLDIPLDHDTPVRLLHLSFRDLLVDKRRKEMNPFWIDDAETHGRLAGHCLRLLDNVLKEDICDVKWPGTRQSEVPAEQVVKSIPADTAYACCYWVWHFQNSGETLRHGSHVDHFLQNHFLHWLETLGWLGRLSSAIAFIGTLQSLVQISECTRLQAFLLDAKRFVLKNTHITSIAPLQVYHSALIFAPVESAIRRTFEKRGKALLSRSPEMPSNWSPELLVLHGHDWWVRTVAFSPDEQLLASGTQDGKVHLWSVTTGEEIWTLKGHEQQISSVAFSRNGQMQLLASASSDGTIRLWDTSTGEELWETDTPYRVSPYVAFSRDGQLLPRSSVLDTSIPWGELVFLQAPAGDKLRVAFSHDGRLLSAFGNGTVREWSLSGGKDIETLEGEFLCSPWAFSADQQLAASGTRDGTVHLWHVVAWRIVTTLKGHKEEITAIAFSPDGDLLGSASSDGMIRLWEHQTGDVRFTFSGHSHSVGALTFSADGHTVLSTCLQGTIRLWSVRTGEQRWMFQADRMSAGPTISPTGSLVAIPGRGTVRIRDVNIPNETLRLQGRRTAVFASVLSPNGDVVASLSEDATIRIWDTMSGIEKLALKGCTAWPGCAVFSRDAQMLATLAVDRKIHVFAVSTGENLHVLHGGEAEEGDTVRALAFCPKGRFLACSSISGIRVWNLGTHEQTCKIDAVGMLDGLTFATGGLLLSSSAGNTICLWDPSTGELLRCFRPGRLLERLQPMSRRYERISFSSDDKTLMFRWGSESLGSIREFALDIASGSVTRRARDAYLSMRGDEWVQCHGQDCLWVPPEYQASCDPIVQGSRLILGQHHGAVSFLEFNTSVLESLWIRSGRAKRHAEQMSRIEESRKAEDAGLEFEVNEPEAVAMVGIEPGSRFRRHS